MWAMWPIYRQIHDRQRDMNQPSGNAATPKITPGTRTAKIRVRRTLLSQVARPRVSFNRRCNLWASLRFDCSWTSHTGFHRQGPGAIVPLDETSHP
jgi:hypothetical protein